VTVQKEFGKQDESYQQTTASFGAALERLAKAYDADPESRRDLLQEIHRALRQSLPATIICQLRVALPIQTPLFNLWPGKFWAIFSLF
jgi:hypothetical protein